MFPFQITSYNLMISFQAVQKAVDVALDSVQEAGDGHDYYHINHVPCEARDNLTKLFSTWLSEIGVEVSNSQEDHHG